MDFFEAQEQARRRSKWLWLWFFMAVMGVVVCSDLLIYFLFYGGQGGLLPMLGWSAATAAIILLASAFKSMQLSGGGAVVAKDLGGRLVDPNTTDTEERRLLNVVEEMAIASGMPVPQVYMMDGEDGINAFAAGTEPSNAVIGVTRGAVQLLNRDELQGVIAHEFSHILNGDMRLNMRLIGLIFGLVVISMIGRGIFEVMRFQSLGSRRSSKEGGNAMILLLILGVGLIAIGSLGVFFGRMIQAAMSRQREFLADASAVQFTRNPDGLVGALQKIGGMSGKERHINSAKAGEASHLFFSDSGMFSFGMATHPPLEVRIKALDEGWSGEWKNSQLPEVAEGLQESRRAQKKQDGGHRIPGMPDIPVISGLSATESFGDQRRTQSEFGRKILAELDPHLQEATRNRQEAQALIFGLLLAVDEDLHASEVAYLKKHAGEEASELAIAWQHELRSLHSAKKIALMDLSMPTLRQLSRPEYERFLEITRWMIASDAQVNLFEFMLQRVVERHLSSHFEGARPVRVRFHRLSDLAEEANILVSTMAGVGADSEKSRQTAYAQAVRPWREEGWWTHDLAGPHPLDRIGEILRRFDQASPLVKRDLLMACGRAAADDEHLSSREAEFLRAVADRIGCALPPFIEDLELLR